MCKLSGLSLTPGSGEAVSSPAYGSDLQLDDGTNSRIRLRLHGSMARHKALRQRASGCSLSVPNAPTPPQHSAGALLQIWLNCGIIPWNPRTRGIMKAD